MTDKHISALDLLDIIVQNAGLIADPRTDGLTDVYAVPLDDIDAARKLLARRLSTPRVSTAERAMGNPSGPGNSTCGYPQNAGQP